MGSLKRPCKTSYRSSIETTVVNCLVFEKIEFLCTDFGETNRQTNRRTASMRKGAFAIASNSLIIFLSNEISYTYIHKSDE